MNSSPGKAETHCMLHASDTQVGMNEVLASHLSTGEVSLSAGETQRHGGECVGETNMSTGCTREVQERDKV